MKDVGSYKNGKLDGYASRYNTDGSLLKAGIFKADKFQYAQAASQYILGSNINCLMRLYLIISSASFP